MSVDVFGRNLKQSAGGRGPPGVGYKTTADGQYDLENKRLCNLAAPINSSDAVDFDTLRRVVQSEVHSVYDVTTRLRAELDEAKENLKKELQIFKDEYVEKMKAVDTAINVSFFDPKP